MDKKNIKLASLYESAWNDVVMNLPGWKKKIIINNWPYENDGDARLSREVAHAAALKAEAVEEKMLSGVNN